MKSRIFVGAMLISALATSAFAGSGTSGGGDVVVFDDRVVLADRFIAKPGTRIDKFDQPIYDELKRVSEILKNFGDDTDFVSKEVTDPLIDYYLVDQIPAMKECESRIPVTLPGSGRSVEQVACTVGASTWIKQDLFNQLSIRDQTLLLIHERLRGYKISLSHEQIADFVVGLDEALEAYNSSLANVRVPLTQVQVSRIEGLRRRLAQVVPGSRSMLSYYRIWPNGGGLVDTSQIDPSAWIDITSQMSDAVVAAGVEVRKSICRNCVLEQGSRLIEVQARGGALKVGADALLEKVVVAIKENHGGAKSLKVGSRSQLRNSSFESGSIGDECSIDRSSFEEGLVIGDRVQIQHSNFDIPTKIGSEAKIDHFNTYEYGWGELLVGESSELSRSKITISRMKSVELGARMIMKDSIIDMPWDSRLLSSRTLKFGESSVIDGWRGSFDGQIDFWNNNAELTFKSGTVLKGTDQPLCAREGKDYDEFEWRGKEHVDSIWDLVALCAKRKKR